MARRTPVNTVVGLVLAAGAIIFVLLLSGIGAGLLTK